MGHVFARLTGYGYSMVPVNSPYKFRWGPNSRAVLIDIEAEETSAEIQYLDGGSYEELCEGADIEDIVEITPVEQPGPFRIETSLFSVEWPKGFTVDSSGSGEGPAYDLVGPDDSLMFVQGPIEEAFVPPIEELVAPGQKLTGQGSDHDCPWIELEYRHEKVKWCQRHFVRKHKDHVFLITGQSKAKVKKNMVSALNALVGSFQFMDAE